MLQIPKLACKQGGCWALSHPRGETEAREGQDHTCSQLLHHISSHPPSDFIFMPYKAFAEKAVKNEAGFACNYSQLCPSLWPPANLLVKKRSGLTWWRVHKGDLWRDEPPGTLSAFPLGWAAICTQLQGITPSPTCQRRWWFLWKHEDDLRGTSACKNPSSEMCFHQAPWMRLRCRGHMPPNSLPPSPGLMVVLGGGGTLTHRAVCRSECPTDPGFVGSAWTPLAAGVHRFIRWSTWWLWLICHSSIASSSRSLYLSLVRQAQMAVLLSSNESQMACPICE